MDKIDIFSYGWAYELILFLLAAGFVIDLVSIIKTLRGSLEDKKEYAELCVKYLKILMYIFAGAFFIIIALTYGLDPASSAIHGVLGVLLLLDAAVSLFIKLKYGKKSGK